MSEINSCGKEEVYGYVLPGWYLCRLVEATYTFRVNQFVSMNNNDWGLTTSNDPSFVFSMNPIEVTEDTEDYTTLNHYRNRLIGDAESCHQLVNACIEAGYDINEGGLAAWLCNRMWKHLEIRGWKPYTVY
jgi:hypothetical protein